MKLPTLGRTAALGAAALLFTPAVAMAQDGPTLEGVAGDLDSTWIIVSAILVFFMQAGFAFLEIGFSRGKNVGTIVAKILTNLSIAAIVWWAVGYAVAAGEGNSFFGTDTSMFFYDSEVGADMTGHFFQFAFAAVSLAIVWGSTLERIKFIAYPIYAVVFTAIIYPVVWHLVWAGGLEEIIGQGVQDFAGSSVVHLTGATGALAAVLILGPRRGKYAADGSPRAIPGHNMPLFGLAVLILWLGWFGFNAGSTVSASGAVFAQVAIVTNLGAAAGVLGAIMTSYFRQKTIDVGMAGNGAIAGLVAVTAPAGYVEPWAAVIIGLIGGILVVLCIIAIDKKIDDPVGVLSAHGVAGIWGTLACGIFTSPDLALEGQNAGMVYGFSDGLTQFGAQAAAVALTFVIVFVLSYLTFKLIDMTVGLRVSAEEEIAGLDITEHGMYGYPEQFIPEAELIGYDPTPILEQAARAAGTKQPATTEV